MKKFAIISGKHTWVCDTSHEIDETMGMEIACGIVSLEDLECLAPAGIDLKLGFYWIAVRRDLKGTEMTKGCKIIRIEEEKTPKLDAIYMTRFQAERHNQKGD